MSGKRLCFTFLHTRKEQVFPKQISVCHQNVWGDSGLLYWFWGDAHVEKWKADWGVRHVKLFSLCLSEVLQDLI